MRGVQRKRKARNGREQVNERRRQQLRPWIRRLPTPLIYLVFVVLSPLAVVAHVVVGAWDGLKEGVGESTRLWRS